MRFTVSSAALSGKLAAPSWVINCKNSLPILGDSIYDVANYGIETVTNKTTINKVVNSKQVTHTSKIEPFTYLTTLQSDNSYAERGYQQQDCTQEEGNNAQRGRCKTRRAVFRVGWHGRGKESVRNDEISLLRQSRLARHRKRVDGVLLGEEKRGSGGRWRAGAAN